MANPRGTPRQTAANQAKIAQANIFPTINARDKLANWVLFNILIAVLPIVLRIAIQLGNNEPVNIPDLFSHGELLLISVAITADAMGELILKGKTQGRNGRAIGICAVIGIFSMAWFGSLTSGSASNTWSFTVLSLVLFSVSVYVGLGCKAAAEV